MPSLKINTEWIDTQEEFRPEFDQSFGQLGINADGTWLTEWEAESGAHGQRVEVPAFPLAEWIAENWWSILFEPEKGGQSRKDPHFRARHWIGTAREGFALPDAWMFSAGRGSVQIAAEPTFLAHARLAFRNGGSAQVSMSDIERELASFVDSVVARLDAKGIVDTGLHAIWAAYKGLHADERRFCQLLGALGISPYDSPPDLAELLTTIMGGASDSVIDDFCEAAEEGNMLEAADDMVKTLHALDGEPELDLSALFRLYNRGERNPKRAALQAVAAVRRHFNIDERDPKGGEKLIEQLGLQGVVYDRDGIHEIDDPVLHGSLRKERNGLKLNLIRQKSSSRRYDALRACYIAWTQANDGDRLVTRARVPDQQASRIFSAEIHAPILYIKSRAANNMLSQYGIEKLSRDLDISSAVIVWQAKHNRIELTSGRSGHWG